MVEPSDDSVHLGVISPCYVRSRNGTSSLQSLKGDEAPRLIVQGFWWEVVIIDREARCRYQVEA